MDEKKLYLGTGVKFPPQVNPATGKFEMVSDEESVKECVYLILMTQKRERFIHPDFGCDLLNFAFCDDNRSLLNLMAADLARDIKRGESRVKNVQVAVDTIQEEGKLIITVDYVIRQSNREERIILPYYIQGT